MFFFGEWEQFNVLSVMRIAFKYGPGFILNE